MNRDPPTVTAAIVIGLFYLSYQMLILISII